MDVACPDAGVWPGAAARYAAACLPLRLAAGLALAAGAVPPWAAVVPLLLAAAVFAAAYARKQGRVWKNYARPVAAYLAAAAAAAAGCGEYAGALLAADALVGLQSRHTASLLRKAGLVEC